MVERTESFKDRLEKALNMRDVRPVELSEKTGISQSTISQYRSGYAEPKADKLALIASALNVNPTWLMGIDVSIDIPAPTDYYERFSPEAAALEPMIRNDQKLVKALIEYFRLTDNEKQHVIDTIYLLSQKGR